MKRVGNDSARPRAFAHIQQMLDLEVDGDTQNVAVDAFEKIGGACAEVDDRPGAVEALHQTPVCRHAAEVSVDAAEVTERALHVGTRRVVFVEKLGLVETRRRKHYSMRFNTNAEFFDPNAIVLQTAALTRARRPRSGT
jgi:hypothetical protein